MTLRIALLFCLIINSTSYATEYNHAIDSLSHIRIDSIILFDDPYIVCNAQHERKRFVPVWRKAYDATSVPTSFNRNADEAVKYLHSSLNVDISELQDFYDTWVSKPDPTIDLTWYVLGDIYFYDEITNKNYIYSAAWGGSYNFPVRLSQLDINLLGSIHKSKLDTCDYYYPFYHDDHGTYSFYIEEKQVVKKCNALFLYEICNWEPGGKGGAFSSAKGFLELVNRQNKYTRSRIANGQRIFETVKNTPDGPVVVKQEKDEDEANNYWWVLVASAVLVLILILLMKKHK